MRVLFTTRGSAGHVGPLVPFARACLSAGHEVVVSAQRQFEGNVTLFGLAFSPVDEPARDEWMPLMAKFAKFDIDTADGATISRFFAGLDLRAELPALRALVERWRPDVIVRETGSSARRSSRSSIRFRSSASGSGSRRSRSRRSGWQRRRSIRLAPKRPYRPTPRASDWRTRRS
jgi:hypothetical protein